MTDQLPMPPSGAARIDEHPVLAPLPAAEMVTFRIDGVAVSAREGEPLAAALLAAGYRVFRTMPRFADPRGGYCMVGRCADCFMVVDGVPNVRACSTPVRAGLEVRVQRGLGEPELPADARDPAGARAPVRGARSI